MSFDVIDVLSLPLSISIMQPTLVDKKMVLSTAFTALSSIDLKSVNLPWFGDMWADAPESFIVIQMATYSLIVFDKASLTMLNEKV